MKTTESYPNRKDIPNNSNNFHNMESNTEHFNSASPANQSNQISKTEKRRRAEEKLEAKKLKDELGLDIMDCLDDDLWEKRF